MSDSHQEQERAAPGSGDEEIPIYAELAADPVIAGLLKFEPAERKTKRHDGWTPERQRAFVAVLAATGSMARAVRGVGMTARGLTLLLKEESHDSFRTAVERARALGLAASKRKMAERVAAASNPGPA